MQNNNLPEYIELLKYIKETDRKDLIEIIDFLLNWLEDEHMGTKERAKEEIAKTWGVDLW